LALVALLAWYVYINTLMLQLAHPQWPGKLTARDLRALTPAGRDRVTLTEALIEGRFAGADKMADDELVISGRRWSACFLGIILPRVSTAPRFQAGQTKPTEPPTTKKGHYLLNQLANRPAKRIPASPRRGNFWRRPVLAYQYTEVVFTV